MPSLARRSRFGVWIAFEPYEPRSAQPMSSTMMKTMFGRSGSDDGRSPPQAKAMAARTSEALVLIGRVSFSVGTNHFSGADLVAR